MGESSMSTFRRLARPARRPRGARLLPLAVAGLLVLAGQSPALADTVSNSITSAGQSTITAGGSTSIGYTITNQNTKAGDPENSCNPADGSAATLTVNAPADVTVSPASQVFDKCSVTKFFSFSSNKAGTYTITVSVTDSGIGVYDASAAAFTLTVAPPVVTNTAPTVTLTGVKDTGTYEFGSVPLGTCNVVDKEDGNSSFPASLGDVSGARAADGLGTQTQTCSYTDVQNGGGLTAKASATYTIVDSTPPVLTVAAPAPLEATGPTTPVTFTATAYDAVDAARPVVCATTAGATYASGDSFAVGSTTLTCSSTDKAGNTGTSQPFDVVVSDTTPPVVTTSANLSAAATSADGATVTYDAPAATDIVDGSDAVTCDKPSGSLFPLGTTTVTCSARDAAGNPASASFVVNVQDQGKPVVSVPADVTVEATSGDGAPARWSGVSATDDVDGTLPVGCSATPGDTFPLGTTEVTCTATDRAGNAGSNSFTVTVEDTTGPQVDAPHDLIEEATSSSGAVVTFATSANDLVDGSVPVSCDPVSGSTFPLGHVTVTCSAIDAHGNPGTASFTVTVHDTTAPALTVSQDLTSEATGPEGATVSYDAATATDVVDGPVTPTCSPASGTVFALGETKVTCTATDASDNTAEKSFTVTVADTTPPVVHTPANLVVGNDLGKVGASQVTWASVTATDLVSGSLTATCSPESGSAFPMGKTTVTCSAVDGAGNPGTGTFVVDVQDQNKPVVAVPSDMKQEATSSAGAVVTWTGVSALDDVDGAVAATCDRTSGDTFPLGDTVVTCTAEDGAGNVGQNHFTVTVQDTTGPQVTVPTDVIATATSAGGAVVTYPSPTATDLVDGKVATTCDKASGSVFPLGLTKVTCTAKDKTGNSGSASFMVTVTVPWSNVLQPVNANGSSTFKLGSTVPVKFALTGSAAGVTDLPARLFYTRLGDSTAVETEAVSTAKATTGNLVRYDPTGGQYIFNLGTKGLSAGTYQLRIDLGDGVSHRVTIGLS
jgi:hypothetical protein